MKIKIRDIYNFIGVFLLCALYFFETPISLLGTQLLIVLQIGITLCFIMAASVHGRISYTGAIILLLKYTIKALKYFSKTQEYQYKYAAMLSFCFQIFYLLYSLSGNCLYDMTFYLYIIAMAITGALNFRIDKQRLE